jgi:hypothetical protein
LNTASEKTYRRFVLGIASEDEERRVEEAILAGEVDGFFLHDIEDDLIDDYLLGSITSEERDGFMAHFVAVDERRQRLAFAAELIEYARRQPAEKPSVNRKLALDSSIIAGLFWRRAALLATAVSVLLVALVSFEQIKLRRQVQIANEARNELTRLRGALAIGNSGSSHSDTLSSVTPRNPQGGADWMPTIEFGASTRSVYPMVIRIPAHAQFVRIDLKLSLPLAEKYRMVVLASSGKQLWAQEFPGSILPAAQQSTIVVPASILLPGLYHFQIERASAEGQFEQSEDHVFRVAKE